MNISYYKTKLLGRTYRSEDGGDGGGGYSGFGGVGTDSSVSGTGGTLAGYGGTTAAFSGGFGDGGPSTYSGFGGVGVDQGVAGAGGTYDSRWSPQLQSGLSLGASMLGMGFLNPLITSYGNQQVYQPWMGLNTVDNNSVATMGEGAGGKSSGGLGTLGMAGLVGAGAAAGYGVGAGGGGGVFGGTGGNYLVKDPGPTAVGAQQVAADPYSPYRQSNAAQYYNALQGGQTDITKMPGYAQYQSGVMDPAIQQLQRTMAARGMSYSGNELTALQQQGQQGYYGFMQDYMNRLATGAGVSQSASTGAAQQATATNQQQQSQMQLLGGVMQGIGSWATPANLNNLFGIS